MASKEDAEGILALIMLTRLHDEWVGDWKPNGRYSSICVYEQKITIEDWVDTQFLLSFPTRKMAEEFLNCFNNMIEKARKFI